MVDPNRKINRLTDKDIEFLDDCQNEFANRFSEDDAEFMEHCSKPLADPPIIENWGFSAAGYNNRGGSGGQRTHYGAGHRHNRGGDWNRHGRGFDRGYRDRHRNNYRPYERPNDNGRRDERPHQPMTIRRDYGNFVPASKE